ncbi:MAG: YeeE/YedE thiosulfate transporter family protein [Chloroflexota bacterium]
MAGLAGYPAAGLLDKPAGAVVTFIFAFLVGFLIQRSRWCNASAIRDAILFKSYRNTRPLLLAMMVITIGFTVLIAFGVGHPIRIVAGMFTLTGMFLFGVGMVLGGACTVSTWVRTGEGNLGAAWALLYTFVGMFFASMLWNVLRWPPASYLQSPTPNLSVLSFGAFDATSVKAALGPVWGPLAVIGLGVVQVVILALIYRRLGRPGKRPAVVGVPEEKRAVRRAPAAAPALPSFGSSAARPDLPGLSNTV